MGNPWILNDIYNYLNTMCGGDNGSPVEIQCTSLQERLNVIKEHLYLNVKEWVNYNLSAGIEDATAKKRGEHIAVREMRKQICWYIKNLKESSKIREIINHLESKEEVIQCLEEYFKDV